MKSEIKRTFHPNGQLAIEASYIDGRQSGIERQWHPNGQLASEGNWIDGLPNGVTRQWHSNGVLAMEMPVKNGFVEGTVKEWNDRGELLGAYEIRNGCGIMKSWYPNGHLRGETTYVNGQLNGRICLWDDAGGLIAEEFQIAGKKVSKKKYLETSKSDSTLPQYNGNEPKPHAGLPSTKYRQHKAPVSEEARDKHNAFIAAFRDKSNQSEARQWLAGNDDRNIGEMMPAASREIVEEGYQAGAAKIIAVDIQGDTTDCLIVELPPKGLARKRVFEWNNELAQNSGFDPDVDWGQNELFVFFD